ncbi:MAG: P-loop NTPase [Solirubrobacteraceae bacterium]
MAKLYAMISHKGGTGRTVATANLAYRLVLNGTSVCCVDLDLTSPTFGAVLNLPGLERGAEDGLHDLLPKSDGQVDRAATEARTMLKNVWALNQERDFQGSKSPTVGAFDLLPGKAEVPPLGSYDLLAGPLSEVLTHLDGYYDVVFVDVRSGLSDAAMALAKSGLQPDWIVFYRWTPQHIEGAGDLVGKLSGLGSRVLTVRTAYLDPDKVSADNKTWYFAQDRVLKEQEWTNLGTNRLGSVPFDPLLQWREKFLTDEDVKRGLASKPTVDAYREVAELL